MGQSGKSTGVLMLESLFVLIPISVLFVIVIGVAFWWAIFAGQFDDSQAAAESILADNDTENEAASKNLANK